MTILQNCKNHVTGQAILFSVGLEGLLSGIKIIEAAPDCSYP